MTILPSIIASDQKELNSLLKRYKSMSVHLDIMDGDFVKNKSLWFDFKLPKGKYEAHLMTTKPEMFIGKHYQDVDKFIVQIETVSNVDDLIDFVQSVKRKIFFALKPETPITKIKKHLKEIDGVLIMTVHPGKYGATFLPKMLNKVKAIRKLNKKIPIQVDGHMIPETISLAKSAGANIYVVGSYLHDVINVKKAMKELENS